MIDWKKFFKRVGQELQRPQGPDPRTLGAGEMAQYAMKKGCPVCGHNPMGLIMGPGSGNGENAFCDNCGSRFTMYPLPGHPMMDLVMERELSQEELKKHAEA